MAEEAGRESEPGREKVLAALMGALAVALPQAFHLVGLGSLFLPMHLPVALAGFVVRPGLAASVGVLAPVLSTLITGMPPVPLVPVMAAELATLGAVASLLARKLRLPVWVALPGAIAARMAVTALLITVAGRWLGLPPKMTAAGWIAGGAPGILLQLVAVPLALRLLRERGVR
ncbi:MAG TPA: ECF transporter S component [Armatimonadota bacterium]|jgi:hypothetical protein|nr:ECF transporter S component [Armatimonadota bacterium]HOQ28009.1 ECF transporter S component [Armatimonadota bacterium]HPO73871.1 ECF transporter S component [Armatimonadota bacterium]HPT98018.1 ECF transporter S component [Armatimonadota bacterium]